METYNGPLGRSTLATNTTGAEEEHYKELARLGVKLAQLVARRRGSGNAELNRNTREKAREILRLAGKEE